MNYKKTNANKTTVSRDVKELSKETNNIYSRFLLISEPDISDGKSMKKS